MPSQVLSVVDREALLAEVGDRAGTEAVRTKQRHVQGDAPAAEDVRDGVLGADQDFVRASVADQPREDLSSPRGQLDQGVIGLAVHGQRAGEPIEVPHSQPSQLCSPQGRRPRQLDHVRMFLRGRGAGGSHPMERVDQLLGADRRVPLGSMPRRLDRVRRVVLDPALVDRQLEQPAQRRELLADRPAGDAFFAPSRDECMDLRAVDLVQPSRLRPAIGQDAELLLVVDGGRIPQTLGRGDGAHVFDGLPELHRTGARAGLDLGNEPTGLRLGREGARHALAVDSDAHAELAVAHRDPVPLASGHGRIGPERDQDRHSSPKAAAVTPCQQTMPQNQVQQNGGAFKSPASADFAISASAVSTVSPAAGARARPCSANSRPATESSAAGSATLNRRPVGPKRDQPNPADPVLPILDELESSLWESEADRRRAAGGAT